MKPTVFLALALAALVLGHRLNALEPTAAVGVTGEPSSTRASHRPAAPAADGLLRVAYEAPPQAGPRQPSPTDDPLPPGSPARLAPHAAVPASAVPDLPASAASRPAAVAEPESPSWRDSALDLLSQIGVLCPAAGCDSLEDD